MSQIPNKERRIIEPMGLRVQKSIRLGKHLRINLSKSGLGASINLFGVTVGAGPRGPYVSVNLPGSGVSYRQNLTGGRANVIKQSSAQVEADAQAASSLPEPGFFAAGEEKELFKGLEAYHAGQSEEALKYFLAAAEEEPGAAIMAAALLQPDEAGRFRAIELLERVVESDEDFPTPLMEKYLADLNLTIEITPSVAVDVPVNGLVAPLLLVELYQATRRVQEAIALLDEVAGLASEPVLLLSLCELYTSRAMWPQLIDQAKAVEPDDDVTTSIVIFYGRAMQSQELHEAAVSVFNKALRKKAGRSPQVRREAIYWRAVSYEAQGKTAQARKEWELLYAEDPDFKDVAQRLGSV